MITIHPSALGGTEKDNPWGVDPSILGVAYAYDIVIHECIHVSVEYRLGGWVGTGSIGWRTRAEHEAQPNMYPAGHGSGTVQAHLTPAAHKRATLTHETDRLAEDFTVLLRRQMRRDGGY